MANDVHVIKFWKFEYKSQNFWITVLCVFLLFITAMTAVLCWTVVNAIDKFTHTTETVQKK